MFWIILFIGIGATYRAASSMGLYLLACLALGIVLSVPLLALQWINDTSGITSILESSLIWLAGPGGLELQAECVGSYSNEPSLGKLGIFFVGAAVGIATILLVVAIMIGTSITLVIAFGSAMYGLFSHEDAREKLNFSFLLLTILAGSVIVAGLGFRLSYFLSGLSC